MKTKLSTLTLSTIATIFLAASYSYGQARPQPMPKSAPLPVTAPTTTTITTVTATAPSSVTTSTETVPVAASASAIVTSSATAAPPPAAAEPQRPLAGAGPNTDGANNDQNKIIPAPTLMSYTEARDNFGRRIADNFIVVQVTIKNPDITHQFLLQDMRVVFDPNECDKAGEFYKQFKVQDCHDKYDNYLKYPIAYAPTSQSALQAVASIGQYRSPRNFFFKALDLAATMGGALTGFNFVGRDGKAGLSVFNGTFLTASKTFLPDLTLGQLAQLTDQSYKPNTLLETKDAKTYCVFLPANQFLNKTNWDLYKKKMSKGTDEALELRRVMQLVLTVSVSGVAIEPAPAKDQPATPTGGNVPKASTNKGAGSSATTTMALTKTPPTP
jgi:hypothetical protein